MVVALRNICICKAKECSGLALLWVEIFEVYFGGFHDISGALQRGGHGGGAVYIGGNSVSGSGLINANGTSGFDNVGVRNYQGGAGGGAGGMVLFDVTTSTFTNATVNYGAGLNGTNGSQQAASSYRGGDGSLGRIFPTPTPTTSGQQ